MLSNTKCHVGFHGLFVYIDSRSFSRATPKTFFEGGTPFNGACQAMRLPEIEDALPDENGGFFVGAGNKVTCNHFIGMLPHPISWQWWSPHAVTFFSWRIPKSPPLSFSCEVQLPHMAGTNFLWVLSRDLRVFIIYIYHIIIYPLCKCIHVFVFMNFPWGHQSPPISSCYPLSGCWNGFHDSQTYGKVAMPRRVGNPIKPGIPNQSVGQIYKNTDLKIRQQHQKSWNIWLCQMACQIKSTIIGNNLNLISHRLGATRKKHNSWRYGRFLPRLKYPEFHL